MPGRMLENNNGAGVEIEQCVKVDLLEGQQASD